MHMIIHRSGQISLPLNDRKRDIFYQLWQRGTELYDQFRSSSSLAPSLRKGNFGIIAGLALFTGTLSQLTPAAETTAELPEMVEIVTDNPYAGIDQFSVNTVSSSFRQNTHGQQSVDLRDLEGMQLASLNALYFGIDGEAPAFAKIDFGENLEEAWRRKLAIENVSGATKKSYREVLDRWHYGDRGVFAIEDFVAEADQEIQAVHGSIDYRSFCNDWDARVRSAATDNKLYLGRDGCALVQNIAGQLTGRDLIAYGMTELFPLRNGEQNIKLMNILVSEAGSEYLNTIPALGDRYLSFGFYQFTSLAVRYDADISARGGANKVSLYADREYRVPDSVKLLEREDHHRAAFYFAVYNIANWIRTLNAEDRVTLRRIYKNNMSVVAKFIAAAHHNPSKAITGARKWVKRDGKKDLEKYLPGFLDVYTEKTSTNRAALDRYLENVT